ncbi:mitochondrial carrier domain-containing protein [Phakopsora pachyrhizi]|uniref:Mitochondrial carrier domain-containing protein n=1 Tax=Phakopsora pachyrhizi TaxID=170000 RepID=A0AAV0BQR0_PHAPC|nr:mitochondrial carrier domain-containing protein [Phakopsora pachyrhizi]CAH7667800.1 mitochondrial carrier domain-containing protein [Phakopsora pachyrhizi]CAH7688553.1 mitochondrial carrier domain-containing protein [Phakopsora pachyrhizi]
MRGLLRDLDGKGGGRWSYLIGAESIISGAGAGLVSSVLTCPLDVVKTKLQAQGGFNPQRDQKFYRGLFGTLGTIWKEEGFRGLYRGLGPTIIGYLPTWAIYFTIYDAAKLKISYLRPNHEEDVVSHVLAAMSAGATSTIATNPLWLIKTRFMTQRIQGSFKGERYKHTLDAFCRIYQKEGLQGFYRGLVPSLFGITHVAIQFPLYERIKLFYKKDYPDDLPSSKILVASACSKMLASLITYPHEVLRTRLQTHEILEEYSHLKRPNGSVENPYSKNILFDSGSNDNGSFLRRKKISFPRLRDTLRSILDHEGVRGFYHGMGVNLVRTVPSSALTILTYELLMRQLTSLTRLKN